MKTNVLFRYCWADLFSEGVRLVPLLQLSLLVSCATAYLFCKGLPEHQKFLRLQELANNPGARSLHILGNSGLLGGGQMLREDYESLKEKMESIIGPEIIECIVPDHGQVEITFRSGLSDANRKFKGKILNDKDSSLIGQKLSDGNVLTSEMLQTLLDKHPDNDRLYIVLGRRFKSDMPAGDLSHLRGQFEGLDWWIPEIVPFCELANEQIDQSHFYVFKSQIDRMFTSAMVESKVSHSVNVRMSPGIFESLKFRNWCAKLNLRPPLPYDRVDDLVVARLTQLPGPGAKSKFGWKSLLAGARVECNFPKDVVLEVEDLHSPEEVADKLVYRPAALDGMYIVVREIRYLSLVKKTFIDWLEEVTAGLKAKSNAKNKANLGATTAMIENPIMVRLVEEVDLGAAQARRLVTLFIVSMDILVVISFLIIGIVRVQVTKSVLGLLRMMGASRIDLITISLCQNMMLGLMGLGLGYVFGYSLLTLYFSMHGVPLAVFFNPFFILTSLLSFALGLMVIAIAASCSAISVSFESPARLINAH